MTTELSKPMWGKDDLLCVLFYPMFWIEDHASFMWFHRGKPLQKERFSKTPNGHEHVDWISQNFKGYDKYPKRTLTSSFYNAHKEKVA